VRTGPEREVLAHAGAVEPELRGVVVHRFVAVRRREPEHDAIAFVERTALDCRLGEDRPREDLHRRVEPQRLLHERGNARAIPAQLIEEVGSRGDDVEAIADQVPRRLVARDDQEHHLGPDRAVGEVLAVDVGVDEARDRVVRWFGHGAVLVDEALDVTCEVGVRVGERRRRAGVLRFEQLVGPLAEAVLHVGRHAEHVRDHDRRERIEHLHEVHRALRAAFDGLVGQCPRAGADERLVLHRAVRGDDAVDHPPNAPVPRLGNRRDHHVVLVEGARVHEGPDELVDVVEPRRHTRRSRDVVARGRLDDPARPADLRHRLVPFLRAGRVRVELHEARYSDAVRSFPNPLSCIEGGPSWRSRPEVSRDTRRSSPAAGPASAGRARRASRRTAPRSRSSGAPSHASPTRRR
jgi:hypothetical protein